MRDADGSRNAMMEVNAMQGQLGSWWFRIAALINQSRVGWAEIPDSESIYLWNHHSKDLMVQGRVRNIRQFLCQLSLKYASISTGIADSEWTAGPLLLERSGDKISHVTLLVLSWF